MSMPHDVEHDQHKLLSVQLLPLLLHTNSPATAAAPLHPHKHTHSHVVAGRPHAYVSCCRSLKLRSLLSSVVGQLAQGGKRKRAQAFAGAAGTEHSLLWELKGGLLLRVCCAIHSHHRDFSVLAVAPHILAVCHKEHQPSICPCKLTPWPMLCAHVSLCALHGVSLCNPLFALNQTNSCLPSRPALQGACVG